MIFEIRNAGFINRGAFLMLLSVAAECRAREPECAISMVPSGPAGHQPFTLLARHGFFPRVGIDRFGGLLNRLGGCIPSRLRQRYGLVLESEVEVVFDAAGFAYGDPWPDSNLRSLAITAHRAANRGARFFLLAQSFGRFSSRSSRSLLRGIADDTAWIFPRDAASMDNLRDVLGEHPRMSIAPDFTCLLPGVAPLNADRFRNTIAIIPNMKMLDRTDGTTRANYLPVLAAAIRVARIVGLEPKIVIHESADDQNVASCLAEMVPGTEIVDEPDPLALKGILGNCRGCIGSRYHGLVSSLSQGVPSLATSWADKYQSLLEAYGIPDGLLDLRQPDLAAQRVSRWLEHELPDLELRLALVKQAKAEQRRSLAMWDHVFGMAGVSASR